MLKRKSLTAAIILSIISCVFFSSFSVFADDPGGENGGGQNSGGVTDYVSPGDGSDSCANSNIATSMYCDDGKMVWQYIRLDDQKSIDSGDYGPITYYKDMDTLILRGYSSGNTGVWTTITGCAKMGGVYRYGPVARRDTTIGGYKFEVNQVIGTMAIGYGSFNTKTGKYTSYYPEDGPFYRSDYESIYQGRSWDEAVEQFILAYNQALTHPNAPGAQNLLNSSPTGYWHGGTSLADPGTPLAWFCWYPPNSNCQPGDIWDSETQTCKPECTGDNCDSCNSSSPNWNPVTKTCDATPINPEDNMCPTWHSKTQASHSSSSSGTSSVIAAAKNTTLKQDYTLKKNM